MKTDPAADAEKTAAQAAVAANADAAMRRRARAQSSLLTSAGQPAASSVMGFGKQTLGG